MVRYKISLIGMGPGSPDYLLPAAKKAVKASEYLVGTKRHLGSFKSLRKKNIFLEDGFGKALEFLRNNNGRKKTAVLLSGDPGLYSMLGMIKKSLKKEDFMVIPGLSSMQLAFSRINDNWQDALILSLHGRTSAGLAKKVKNSGKVFMFLDCKNTPDQAARALLKAGSGNRKAFVFENLSYSDERIISTDLRSLSAMRGFKLCVMIIK